MADQPPERKPWKALTPDEKRARREEWRARSPEERRDHIREITDAAQSRRFEEKGMTFPGLGVRVRDGQVYPYPTLGRPAFGPAAGARVEITDPTKAQMIGAGLASGVALGSLLGPVALAPALFRKSKAVAFVVCANGKFHEKKLDGTTAIRAAQRDAVKFNALTGASDMPPETAGQPHEDAAATLRKLAAMHDEGLLTDDEFAAKRAEVIARI